MLKKNKIFLIGLFILFASLVVVQHFVPKPINWDLNFNDNSKSPYGCKVAKELLSEIFPGKEIISNSTSFFVGLNNELSAYENMIILSDDFNLDETDQSSLLDYVAKGNNAFISAYSFSDMLSDTLQFKTNSPLLDTTFFKPVNEALSLVLDSTGNDSSFSFKRKMPVHFFEKFDTANSEVLGKDRNGNENFIAMKFGKGTVYIHCQPLAFTNFHVLYSNYNYACTALAFLPVSNTIWDQYYKPDKYINTSPVRYILSKPPLRSAYYMILLAILVYMTLGIRRKQRIIPVIHPLQNNSLNFIKTVGRFYYKSQNHIEIARKKSIYFHEFLRTRYFMNVQDARTENILHLSVKSGIEADTIRVLLEAIFAVGKNQSISREDLIAFHQILNNFYKKCK